MSRRILSDDITMPAEWDKQSMVQLTWPHKDTDWKPILEDITNTYVEIAKEIAMREQLIIVAPDTSKVKAILNENLSINAVHNIHYLDCPTNDTWARDHAFITVKSKSKKYLLDFKFNGWGDKYPSNLDNAINRNLYNSKLVDGEYTDCNDFVLEGGSVESDGKGTIFTTSGCLMAPHRNQPMSKQQIEEKLKEYFGAKRIVWLDYGNLTGDDTDGHIDTLVRIAPDDTLLYVGCDDKKDEQYENLKQMEKQLRELRTINGRPYRLLKLPMPVPIYNDGERLPATYANFLVINGAVLIPTYNQPIFDKKACDIIASAFKDREIIGIDSRNIIIQHGSLHCCTMQYPI